MCKILRPSSNTELQTKLVHKRTQSIAIKVSAGSMKRQTDTRNYGKIQYK